MLTLKLLSSPIDKSWRAPVRQGLACSTFRCDIRLQLSLISRWDCEWNLSHLEGQARSPVRLVALRPHDGFLERSLAAWQPAVRGEKA